MPLDPLVAAKKVCETRNWSVSNLTVNKILYFANMVWLGQNGGSEPLIDEPFEAWDYGPVIPLVYHRAKMFGAKPVRNIFTAYPGINGTPEADALARAAMDLREHTGGQLVAITHWRDGAWAKNYIAGARGRIIPSRDIYAEYCARVDRIRQSEAHTAAG